jgi:hypothetical protein
MFKEHNSQKHSPTMNERTKSGSLNAVKYATEIGGFRESSKSIFQDFIENMQHFHIFAFPFEADVSGIAKEIWNGAHRFTEQ